MKYIYNPSIDPYFNLAFEEYIFNKCKPNESYFILWRNSPAIIVGKHQNTMEEINSDFVEKNAVKVVRRMSGGGAVYHDLGNLNFTFIVTGDSDGLFDFKKFTLPILKMLDFYGVKAELNGRNDLTIESKKFSGNSQYARKGTLLHHGTLMVSSDLDDLEEALKVSADKFESKGVKSIRSRVTNISDHTELNIDVIEFKDMLSKFIEEQHECWEEIQISKSQLDEVKKLVDSKYSTWEWNFGKSPVFNYKNSKRYPSGKLEVMLNVNEGIINSCKFFGDFFSSENFYEMERDLIGNKYDKESVKNLLNKFGSEDIIMGIAADQIIECMFG